MYIKGLWYFIFMNAFEASVKYTSFVFTKLETNTILMKKKYKVYYSAGF